MDELRPKLNRIVYGMAALCFLLPFVNFSCAEMPVGSVTGFDMVFGSTKMSGAGTQLTDMTQYVDTGEEQPFSAPQLTEDSQVIKPSVLVISALVCCVLGLFFSFSEGDKARLARIGLSVGGIIALIIFRLGIESELEAESGGMIQAETALGLWLVLGLMAFAIWLNFSIERNPEGPFIRARFDRSPADTTQTRKPRVPSV